MCAYMIMKLEVGEIPEGKIKHPPPPDEALPRHEFT